MKVLIIIPAYNEEDSILSVVNNLKKLQIKNVELDYVVINDGSTDNTKEVCLKNNINFIDLPFNVGIGGAVQTGYKYALYNDYDIAIQFDGDGQHEASYIEKLISEINKGYDIVIGSRFVQKLSKFRSTKTRRIGIGFLSNLIYWCTKTRIYDPTSGFRACNKKVIKLFAHDYLIDYAEPVSIVTVIKNNYKHSEIPVEMKERQTGRSSIRSLKTLYYMIKVSIAIIIKTVSEGKGK
ncbi:MAG TPA: glycosyltransferase family 2 protein [Tenericutes bacterium]|nr:glycosyltransferase family 2 protein [Mycoplasmatota bacterium]